MSLETRKRTSSGDTNSLGSSKGPGDLLKREIKADASQLTLLRVREVTVSAGRLVLESDHVPEPCLGKGPPAQA